MHVVRRVVVVGLAALAALTAGVAAPRPALGAGGLVVTSASAQSEVHAIMECPSGFGSIESDRDRAEAPASATTLSFDRQLSVENATAGGACGGTSTTPSTASASQSTAITDGRVASTMTSSARSHGGGTWMNSGPSALAHNSIDYALTAPAGATYRVDVTLTVSQDPPTGEWNNAGVLQFDAGSQGEVHFAGGTSASRLTFSREGTLAQGEALRIRVSTTAQATVSGIQDASASWDVSLVVTPIASPTAQVSGAVRFEKIPVTRRGLELRNLRPEPAAGVRVEALAPDGDVLAESTTDADGRYALDVPTGEGVRIRASAVMGSFEVRRPTGARDLHFVETEPFDVPDTEPIEKDLLAVDDHQNGPFNLLFVARKCVDLIRTADPDVTFPPLVFRWDPVTELRTKYTRAEGGGPDEIEVAGRRVIDADEFDDVGIAHEFGHYVMHHFGRNESPGGTHRANQSLDPRMAWSEGWAQYFGSAAIGTSKFFRTGPNGGPSPVIDIEPNRTRGVATGSTGEFAVAGVLWDIADSRADAGDRLALGFAPLWHALRATQSDRFVYLGDFIDALHEADPSRGPALRAILATHGVPCVKRSTAPTFARPFPLPIASGRRVTGRADSILAGDPPGSPGLATSSLLYEFTLAAPGVVSVALDWVPIGDAPQDLDLFLLDADGVSLLASESHDPAGASESIVTDAPLPAGTYVVEVASARDLLNRQFEFNRGRFRLRVEY